jgi:large subunit ribosomal protein L7A
VIYYYGSIIREDYVAMDKLPKGSFAVGLRMVTKALEANGASRVYIAEDADLFIKNRIRSLCVQRGVPVQDVRSMKELGTACGIEVGAATAAILKERA